MEHAQGSPVRTYEADDETYLGQMTLSVKARSPKCGELRECGEGVSSRYKPEMRRMEHAQGSPVRTYEADDETYLGQMTLSVKARSPKCGELRECGEGGVKQVQAGNEENGTCSGFGSSHR